MRLSPADKAHKTRTRNAATRIEEGLAALDRAGETDPAKVLPLFQAEARGVRCDAFWTLDNDHRTRGHRLLRQCRNHPEHGPALFALF